MKNIIINFTLCIDTKVTDAHNLTIELLSKFVLHEPVLFTATAKMSFAFECCKNNQFIKLLVLTYLLFQI